MNPEVYSEWISKSLLQRASSTSTANLPVIDSSEALARLHAENYSEKADDDDDLA